MAVQFNLALGCSATGGFLNGTIEITALPNGPYAVVLSNNKGQSWQSNFYVDTDPYTLNYSEISKPDGIYSVSVINRDTFIVLETISDLNLSCACDLEITSAIVNGTSVEVTATSSHGPIAYSIDNWATDQATGIFHNLTPGQSYEIKVNDLLDICEKTFAFDIAPIAAPTEYFLSKNPYFFEIETSAPYKNVRLELVAESAHQLADYKTIYSGEKISDKDGKVYFRLDRILASLLSPEIPIVGQVLPTKCKKNLVNFYIRHKETETPDLVYTLSPLKTILIGGVPFETAAAGFDLITHLTATNQFLTWQPDPKVILPGQLEYLYFLDFQGHDNVTVQYEFLSEEGAPIIEQEVIAAPNALICIPVRKKNILYPVIKVSVLANNAEISAKRTFKVDYEYPLPERTFLFLNSLGCFDTVRAIGHRESVLDTKEEVAERTITPGYKAEEGTLFVWAQSPARKIKQNFGWLKRSERNHLQDFVQAMTRFELVSGKLLPIIVSKQPLTLDDDDKKPVGFTIEYDYAFKPIGNFSI